MIMLVHLRLVEILGGMPLAIDIAAKHLREAPALSFSDYIGKVQNKIHELKIEDEKDSNVKASLELSLDQLKRLTRWRFITVVIQERCSMCSIRVHLSYIRECSRTG